MPDECLHCDAIHFDVFAYFRGAPWLLNFCDVLANVAACILLTQGHLENQHIGGLTCPSVFTFAFA